MGSPQHQRTTLKGGLGDRERTERGGRRDVVVSSDGKARVGIGREDNVLESEKRKWKRKKKREHRKIRNDKLTNIICDLFFEKKK